MQQGVGEETGGDAQEDGGAGGRRSKKVRGRTGRARRAEGQPAGKVRRGVIEIETPKTVVVDEFAVGVCADAGAERADAVGFVGAVREEAGD